MTVDARVGCSEMMTAKNWVSSRVLLMAGQKYWDFPMALMLANETQTDVQMVGYWVVQRLMDSSKACHWVETMVEMSASRILKETWMAGSWERRILMEILTAPTMGLMMVVPKVGSTVSNLAHYLE